MGKKKDTHGFSVCRWETKFSFEEREQAVRAVNDWINTYPEKWQTFPDVTIHEYMEDGIHNKRRTEVTVSGGVWASRLADLAEILQKYDMDMD